MTLLQSTQTQRKEDRISSNFPPKTNPKTQVWIKAITALNCPPTIVDSAKSLGITLDCNLNMRDHINLMAKSARFHLSYLRMLIPFLDTPDLKMEVQALVISRLEYGCSTLSGLPKISLAPLKACFNAAARLLTGSRKFDHI